MIRLAANAEHWTAGTQQAEPTELGLMERNLFPAGGFAPDRGNRCLAIAAPADCLGEPVAVEVAGSTAPDVLIRAPTRANT